MNTIRRWRVALMPTAAAAVSLPRTASRKRPVVPWRMAMVADAEERQDDRGQDQEGVVRRRSRCEPMALGRGTVSGRVPLPPETQVSGTMTPANIRAKASVASAA